MLYSLKMSEFFLLHLLNYITYMLREKVIKLLIVWLDLQLMYWTFLCKGRMFHHGLVLYFKLI